MGSSSSVLYGHGSLRVDLPDHCIADIIEKPPMPVLQEPARAVEDALMHPLAGKSLLEAAREAKSACVLICDITRPVPNGILLPPIIRTLLKAGIAPERICVLVATGLHRPNLDDELRELVGSDWVLDTVRVENHFARNDGDHADLGTTISGTPVKIDRRFAGADLKIVTGLVEPHFMAGYSGGRKVISPGIAHADTITTFHHTRFMEDPLVCNCNLHHNALHEEQVEIVKMFGDVYAVNVCLDAARNLSFVNFGEVIESHAEAVAFMRRFSEINREKRYRCVITSSAGYPLDKTYYQTIKGIVSALGALETGGSLLIASECSEGLGSPEFCHAQAALVDKGIDGFLGEARGRLRANMDEWQTVKLIEAIRHHRVHLYTTGMDSGQRRLTGVTCHDNWARAIDAVVKESAADEVAVIPEGPYVIPLPGVLAVAG